MKTLDDAWSWYVQTKSVLRVILRLADLHWDSLPWDAALGKDSQLNQWNGPPLAVGAGLALEHLDDLAVVVLFSMFEGLVREKVGHEVAGEIQSLAHPVMISAAKQVAHDIERGSFAKVLDHLRTIDPDLVEQVRQVRMYRNWVAHGRRSSTRYRFEPRAVYERLSALLFALDGGTPPG
jgi:hypothetical protein